MLSAQRSARMCGTETFGNALEFSHETAKLDGSTSALRANSDQGFLRIKEPMESLTSRVQCKAPEIPISKRSRGKDASKYHPQDIAIPRLRSEMTSALDYPESISLGKGITMTFEGHLRRVDVRAGEDDDVLIVPSHWHQEHDEVMHVLEGKIKITLGTQVTICTPETGDVFVPRGVPHSLESFKGVPCVVTERNEPLEFDKKELFFRNMGAIPGGFGKGGLVQMMQIFYHGDGFPVFPVHLAWMERAFVTILGGYVAPLLGYRIKYENLKKR